MTRVEAVIDEIVTRVWMLTGSHINDDKCREEIRQMLVRLIEEARREDIR